MQWVYNGIVVKPQILPLLDAKKPETQIGLFGNRWWLRVCHLIGKQWAKYFSESLEQPSNSGLIYRLIQLAK